MAAWALTEVLSGEVWVAYVAFPFSIALGAVCLIGILLAHLKAKRIKTGLGAFLYEVAAMQRGCADPVAEFPDVEDFRSRLGAFLLKELGREAIVRLNSDAGIGSFVPLFSVPVSQQKLDLWGWLEFRSIRLHEFIREASRDQA